MAVPVAEGVKGNMQLAVPTVPGVRVQVPDELKVPVAPEEERVTVPDGVSAVPALEVSITVALQLEAWFTTTGVPQVTDMEVVRKPTTILAEVVVELVP